MQLQNCLKYQASLHTGFALQNCLSSWCPQRLARRSGRGTHFVIAALHSTGASKRLSVVTLRIRRYTCNRLKLSVISGLRGAPVTGKSGCVSLRITMSTSNHRYTLRYNPIQTQVPQHLDVRWTEVRPSVETCQVDASLVHTLESVQSQSPLGLTRQSDWPLGRHLEWDTASGQVSDGAHAQIPFFRNCFKCSLIVGLTFLTLMDIRRQPLNFECLPAFHVYQLELLYSSSPHLLGSRCAGPNTHSVTWLGGLYRHHHNLGRDAVRRGSQEALWLWPLPWGGEWKQGKPLQAQKFNCADIDIQRGKKWHLDCRRGL